MKVAIWLIGTVMATVATGVRLWPEEEDVPFLRFVQVQSVNAGLLVALPLWMAS